MNNEKYRDLMPCEVLTQIWKDNGEDYYVMRHCELYTTAPEDLHVIYLRKIRDFAASLQDENFTVHHFRCDKPKINKNGVFGFVGHLL